MLSKVFYLLSICLRYKLRTSLLSRNYHIFLAIFGFVNAGNKMLELFKLSQRCSCLYLLLINCHTYSLTLHKMHQFAHTIAHFPFIYWKLRNRRLNFWVNPNLTNSLSSVSQKYHLRCYCKAAIMFTQIRNCVENLNALTWWIIQSFSFFLSNTLEAVSWILSVHHHLIFSSKYTTRSISFALSKVDNFGNARMIKSYSFL